MSIIGALLNSMKTALLAAAPGRIVTRTLEDFSDRKKTDLQAGIYTLVHRGQGEITDEDEYLKVLLVGQMELGEKATGEQIEEAELIMSEEVKRFARYATGARVRIKSWQQSMQLERPNGWISAEIEVGPFSLTPEIAAGTLSDFITFHADYDIPPHETGAERAKWLREPPDTSTSKPDAEDHVTLP